MEKLILPYCTPLAQFVSSGLRRLERIIDYGVSFKSFVAWFYLVQWKRRIIKTKDSVINCTKMGNTAMPKKLSCTRLQWRKSRILLLTFVDINEYLTFNWRVPLKTVCAKTTSALMYHGWFIRCTPLIRTGKHSYGFETRNKFEYENPVLKF